MSKVVIVGAGFGGQAVCKALQGKGMDVTVVDTSDSLSIGGTWQYELDDRAARLVIPLTDTLVGKAGKLLANNEVTKLDLIGKTVTLADGTNLPYDYLVLSPGAVSDASSVPGLAESAIDITAQGYPALVKERVSKVAAGSTILITITKTPYKCPPLPFELAFLVDEMLRKKGVRESSRIVVTCPVPWPFGGPDAAKVFKATMAEKGIEYLPEVSVERMVSASGELHTVVSFAGETPDIHAEVVLATFPHRAPNFIMDANLVNPKGSVPVDLRSNRVTKGVPDGEKNVFCVGDACAAVLPAVGVPIPKAGEFAWQGGETVGEIIAAQFTNAPEALPVSRKARCIAESGNGNAIIVAPDFSAAFVNPEEGKPNFLVEPLAGGAKEKVDWINTYAALIVGSAGQVVFAPS